MTGIAGSQCFFTRIYDFRRSFQLPSYESRENFRAAGLFGTETAADARFDHADLAFGNFQSIAQDTANVKRYLCGTDTVEPAVCIDIGKGTLVSIMAWALAFV